MGQEHPDYEGTAAPQGLHCTVPPSPCPCSRPSPMRCQHDGWEGDGAAVDETLLHPRAGLGSAHPTPFCSLSPCTWLAVVRRSRRMRNRLHVRLLSFSPWPRPRLSSCMRRRSRMTSSWPAGSGSQHGL